MTSGLPSQKQLDDLKKRVSEKLTKEERREIFRVVEQAQQALQRVRGVLAGW
jgi:hypothetical protein